MLRLSNSAVSAYSKQRTLSILNYQPLDFKQVRKVTVGKQNLCLVQTPSETNHTPELTALHLLLRNCS